MLAAVWQSEAGDRFAPLDPAGLCNLPQVQTYAVPGPLDVLVCLRQPHLGFPLGPIKNSH